MNRREFLATGIGGGVGLQGAKVQRAATESPAGVRPGADARRLFPRLAQDVFLDAAGGTPLCSLAESGAQRFLDFWRHGPQGGRGEILNETRSKLGPLFAELIGAGASEVGFVHCTKAGEQLVLDRLEPLGGNGNVVTNDLHFSGSLHNLIGLRRQGLDVRIVRARDFRVDPAAMAAAMDERTALVAVSLVSNINGHVEAIRELADLAHRRGAFVYADIIQAAGIVPIDVTAMGLDFAACSGYKWLLGPHGVGFVYVREDLQGGALQDGLFPGHVERNYPPWVEDADSGQDDYTFRAPSDAHRYQPGHVSYLGYSALHAGLELIAGIGVDAIQRHCVGLAQRLRQQVDPMRYRSISPHTDRSPIVTFVRPDGASLVPRLIEAKLVISLDQDRIRVSPALYNTEADVDLLAEVLNRG